MKTLLLLTLLLLSLAISSLSQEKDRRAMIITDGIMSGISVTPEEGIFLLSFHDGTFYADDVNSNWHRGGQMESDGTIMGPSIDEMHFFNRDTGIATGYISFNDEVSTDKNGYYFTADGGKTWEIRNFGGSSWIYETFVLPNGKAWMGGSSGDIYFSSDFGKTWTTLKSPLNSASRVNTIFMSDDNNGIAGALGNEIHITSDNWKTSRRIETPYEQLKHPGKDRYYDNTIEKARLWKNFIVVEEEDDTYYTDTSKIEWKPFPVKVFRFETDTDGNTLFVVTEELKVMTFTSPTKYETIYEKLAADPGRIQVVNHSLYGSLKWLEIFRVNKEGYTSIYPFTTDWKIEDPEWVKRGNNLNWGATDNQLYISENDSPGWYRENSLPISVSSIKLLNDSTAIFWDGAKTNYLYTLHDHKLEKYIPQSPLKNFIASPVTSFSIESGTVGCFHFEKDEISYELKNDSIFTVKKLLVDNEVEIPGSVKKGVNSASLAHSLAAINRNAGEIPSIKDFEITDKDKKNYLALVDEELEDKNDPDRAFYYSVPAMLDTIGPDVMREVMLSDNRGWSTTSTWTFMTLANQSGDTLQIERHRAAEGEAWQLPMRCYYEGIHFLSYNLELARFINSSLPENFMYKDVYDNRELIMEIADYLLYKKEE